MEIGTMAWASPSISRSTSPRAAAGQELYVRYVPGAPGAYRPLSPVVCWAAKRPHENRGDAMDQSRSKHAATAGMMYIYQSRYARMPARIRIHNNNYIYVHALRAAPLPPRSPAEPRLALRPVAPPSDLFAIGLRLRRHLGVRSRIQPGIGF